MIWFIQEMITVAADGIAEAHFTATEQQEL